MAKKVSTSPTRRRVSDTSGLKQLGSGAPNRPAAKIETFAFRERGRDTRIVFRCTEFTCLCPLTGQPDYAQLDIHYIPRDRAIESKSLKNYLWGFRQVGMFHEDVVNVVLDELFAQVSPKWMKVVGRFSIRGGIAIDVETERTGESHSA